MLSRVGLMALSAVACVCGAAPASAAAAFSDFDGDGAADLSIGAPFDSTPIASAAGAADVFWGGPSVLPGRAARALYAGGIDLPAPPPDPGERLAAVQATGDFDADGFDDLVLGAPASQGEVGSVRVLYGTPGGFAAGRSLYLQPHANNAGSDDPGGFFGAGLTAGDFNGDGFDDLAVGVPGHSVDGQISVGELRLYSGSNSGLRATMRKVVHPGGAGIPGPEPRVLARFGAALGVGDFDRDHRDDLVVSAPGGSNGPGGAYVLPGRKRGLVGGSGSQYINAASKRLAGPGTQSPTSFGSALEAGDFDGDGYPDLAIGRPGKPYSSGGGVHVLRGSKRGVSLKRNRFFGPKTPGLVGADAAGNWGAALASGRIDADRFADLIVGSPNGPAAACQGSAQVLFGTKKGLRIGGNQHLDSSVLLPSGVAGSSAGCDSFGQSVFAGNLNGRGVDEIAIGEPQLATDDADPTGGGLVHVLYPNRHRDLSARGYARLSEVAPGSSQIGDGFGASLAAP